MCPPLLASPPVYPPRHSPPEPSHKLPPSSFTAQLTFSSLSIADHHSSWLLTILYRLGISHVDICIRTSWAINIDCCLVFSLIIRKIPSVIRIQIHQSTRSRSILDVGVQHATVLKTYKLVDSRSSLYHRGHLGISSRNCQLISSTSLTRRQYSHTNA